MNLLFRVILWSCLLCSSYQAQAQSQEEILVGQGVVCDSPDQLKVVLEMANSGATSQAALAEVNATAPRACGVLRVAYIKGEVVGSFRFKAGLANITSILVVAVEDEGQMRAVPPTLQFTIFPSTDREA